MYPYGLIGNCQISALVSDKASVDWFCTPRPDDPPVFGKLLDQEGGYFSITPEDCFKTKQEYYANTNILLTKFQCSGGEEFHVTDFCPRFEENGRMAKPIALFRKIELIKGNPKIKISCKPVSGWEKKIISPSRRGSDYLDYKIRENFLRLTTNASLIYLEEDTFFNLHETIYLSLTWGYGLPTDVSKLIEQNLHQTTQYWRTWVKHCSIPSLFQKETIRSALALKLHCFEDTGAILAALTTSLPEEPGHNRNWDYRFCWLRDAAFVISALHNLGHFEEMEGFLKFVLNLAMKHQDRHEALHPVYKLDQSLPLPEEEHKNWSGFAGSCPVRTNNQAAEHVQHNVYGEIILTLAPIFFDERFQHLRTPEYENLLHNLGEMCIHTISKPDAGLWEIRDGWKEHSFSNLMNWAGLERISRIKDLGYLELFPKEKIEEGKERAEKALKSAVIKNSLRNGPGDETFDSALLLLPVLRFPDIKVNKKTVNDIMEALSINDSDKPAFLYRYLRQDDFGTPKSAFLICSFWLVQALAKVGNQKLAKEVMRKILPSANHLGLFAEHFLPLKKEQWGNFPQAYSHVGLINAAFAISPSWDEII